MQYHRVSEPFRGPHSSAGIDEWSNNAEQESSFFHGEALARDLWAEQYSHWIVLIFTAGFALFLIGMVLAGQAPGKSFSLKSFSDIFQFFGEGIGFFLCMRIALRLRMVSRNLHFTLAQQTGRAAPNELAKLRTEAQAAQRAFLAWLFLAIGVACYASGQAIWTSYDVRMNSADVPFPGFYDIGFVSSYIFFLVGTVLLTRRNKASVGRARLLLDAFAVIGAAVAISWFFLLSPLIAGLAQSPSAGASFLSIYFPAGDLLVVAVGALLMFSPLSNKEQQPVFLRLCLGLFFLGITDSLLAYYNLSFSFNTGTVQDVLWPLSMLLIGMAAVEYPRSIAREQEEEARTGDMKRAISPSLRIGRTSQAMNTAQMLAPFILVLLTSAVLLTAVAPRGGAVLIQADLLALALVVLVVIRQSLTLIENNRLTRQMRGELVISRRELQVSRREADEATRTAQDKQALDEGVMVLRNVHARVARGDLAARAPALSGTLLPIAVSLNLMLDRLGAISQRGARYDQLISEAQTLQAAIERLGQGLPAWPPQEPAPQITTELRSLFLGMAHLQRSQESQWRRVAGSLESMNSLTRRLREALSEVRNSSLFQELGQAHFERMILERALREVEMLEQQQRSMQNGAAQALARYEQGTPMHTPAPPVDSFHPLQQARQQLAAATQSAHVGEPPLLRNGAYALPPLFQNKRQTDDL